MLHTAALLPCAGYAGQHPLPASGPSAAHLWARCAVFKPRRWLSSARKTAAGVTSSCISPTHKAGPNLGKDTALQPACLAPAGEAGDVQQPPSAAAPRMQPDPLTFSTGVRDCLGQNLAKVELQVVLATLLSRFRFHPGPQLLREAELAAKTGQPPIAAVYALAEVHVTLQPAGGRMMLFAARR